MDIMESIILPLGSVSCMIPHKLSKLKLCNVNGSLLVATVFSLQRDEDPYTSLHP